MKLLHRLVIDKDHREAFLKVGIDIFHYETEVTKWASAVVVTLNEEDPRWSQVRVLAKSCCPLHTVETEFTHRELAEAESLCFCSKSTTGYPEPSDTHEAWLSATFDLSNYCKQCGTGHRQKAPFRLKSEVKWGRRQTTQLHWVQDAVFVPFSVWEEVFEPVGIECWRVLSRGGRQLESVVQLKIQDVVELRIPVSHPSEACPKCGLTKYNPNFQGFWPKPETVPIMMAKSKQWFGFGGEGFQGLYISHEMYVRMNEKKLNCQYWACSL